MRIAITGGNSNLGKKLIKYYLKKKYKVFCLSGTLKPMYLKNIKIFFYNNNNPIDKNFFIQNKISILIMCSHDRSDINLKNNLNINSTLKIVDAAKKTVNKIIYISSIAASDIAQSNYGKIKFSIENKINKYVTIIRPGMFFENKKCEPIDKLFTIIKSLKFFPFKINEAYNINFVEINELTQKIFEISQENTIAKYIIINKFKINLKNILQIYCLKNKTSIYYLPVPFIFFHFIFKFLKPIQFIYRKIDPIYNIVHQPIFEKNKEFKFLHTKTNYND
tara:strand:- start:3851 stop:4684 length:834 start_codon:yes stop_codon:yes gene_type:complete